jgi:hypothetical protein
MCPPSHFIDATGKEWSFSKERVRTLLSLRSIRYDVSGGDKYYVGGTEDTITNVIGAWAIDAAVPISQIAGTSVPMSLPAREPRRSHPPEALLPLPARAGGTT